MQTYYSIRIGSGKVLHRSISDTVTLCGKTGATVTGNIDQAPTCKACERSTY